MSATKTNKMLEELIKDEEIFLSYLKSRFPLFHKSNFFFRDLEYGIKFYFEKKNASLSAADNLRLAVKMGSYFEEKNFFKKVSEGVWMINMPEYVTSKPGDPF